jgi:hypothetical protein
MFLDKKTLRFVRKRLRRLHKKMPESLGVLKSINLIDKILKDI